MGESGAAGLPLAVYVVPSAPESLFEIFPDACYVYTHRDPAQAMTSVVDMVYNLRKERMSHVTPSQHASEQLSFWAQAIECLEVALHRLGPSRIVNVHIDELQADAVGVAESIYRHFGIPITEAAQQAWRRHADVDPRSGHEQHRYTSDGYKLRAEDVYAAIPNYYERHLRLYGAARSRGPERSPS